MQEYIRYEVDTRETLRTIKPNTAKIFLDNFITICIILGLIIGVLIFLDSVVGLDIFITILEEFNVSIDPKNILTILILIALSLAALMILGNYLANRNLRYEIYRDRIRVYDTQILVLVQNRDIPLKNITRVTYNFDGIMNKLLSSGKIILDLTGMKDSTQELRFIDNTEENVQYIQKIIQEYQSLQQMQFQKNYSIGNIVKRTF